MAGGDGLGLRACIIQSQGCVKLQTRTGTCASRQLLMCTALQCKFHRYTKQSHLKGATRNVSYHILFAIIQPPFTYL